MLGTSLLLERRTDVHVYRYLNVLSLYLTTSPSAVRFPKVGSEARENRAAVMCRAGQASGLGFGCHPRANTADPEVGSDRSRRRVGRESVGSVHFASRHEAIGWRDRFIDVGI